MTGHPGDSADNLLTDPTDIGLSRLREAERRHTGVAVKLAEHEAELRALKRRLEVSERLGSDATQRLRERLEHAEEGRRVALDELARVTHELTVARGGVERADVLEAELGRTLEQAAADRGRLLARIAQLEGQVAEESDARERLARYERGGADELIEEIVETRTALEAAQAELAASARSRGSNSRRCPRRSSRRSPATRTSGSPCWSPSARRSSARRASVPRRARGAHPRARAARLDALAHACRDARRHRARRALARVAARARRDPLGRAAWRCALDRTEGALDRRAAAHRGGPARHARAAAAPTGATAPTIARRRSEARQAQRGREVARSDGRWRPRSARDSVGRPSSATGRASRSSCPSRDGIDHLKRLVAGLRDHTDYPELELVVVDNGSSDGTAEWLAAGRRTSPVTCRGQRGERLLLGRQHAGRRGRGARAAAVPQQRRRSRSSAAGCASWSRRTCSAGRASPARRCCTPRRRTARADGRLVQHRRIALRRTADGRPAVQRRRRRAALRGRVRRRAAGAGRQRRLPADRAKATLEQLGGFSTRYSYGLEDVDLALRRRPRPGCASSRPAASLLYHEESATRLDDGADVAARNARDQPPRAAREVGAAAAPRLPARAPARRRAARRRRAGRTSRSPSRASTPPTAGATGTPRHELGDALEARGWRVSYVAVAADGGAELPDDLDYVLDAARPLRRARGPGRRRRDRLDPQLDRPLARAALVRPPRPAARLVARRRRADRGAHRPQARALPAGHQPGALRDRTRRPRAAVDCVFTGNHWGKDRDIQDGLAPARGQSLAIHGRGWERGQAARPPRPRRRAATTSCRRLRVGQARARRHAGADAALRRRQRPRVRRARGRLARADQLRAAACASCSTTTSRPGRPRRSCASAATPCCADDERRTALAERYRDDGAARAHLRAPRRAADRAAARARAAAVVLHQDRRARLGAGGALGRPALRPGASSASCAGAATACLIQVLEEWENDDGLGYDVVLHLRGLSRHFTEARPVQRPLVHQPPGRADRRGVRRLRPRRDRLRAVRRAHARRAPARP